MKFKDLWRLPKLTIGFWRVWQRNFLYYRKTWIVSLLWTCLEPMMYLGAIGFGLGSYVSHMDGGSYVEYLFPGILCSTAMMVAFFDGTYGSFTKLTFQKTYSTILMTPVSVEEVVFGEILWCACKGFFGSCGVAFIASFMGLVDTWRIIPCLGIVFLIALLFSCLAMIVTSVVRNYDSFVYATSGFIIPLSLFSGVYFPIDQLPMGLRQLTWAMPLSHGVEAVRTTLAVGPTVPLFLHLLYLIVLSFAALNIAIHRIRFKLIG